MIYLDNSATTRPFDSVIKVMSEVMAENYGNAASLHKMGIRSEAVINDAKKTVLERLGLDGEIIFTSGATESNNTVLFGVPKAYRHSGNEIVTTGFEHPSVKNPLKKLAESGYNVTEVLPPKKDEPQDFEERIISAVTENTLMVSVMFVNNETGFITDLSKVYAGVKRKNPKTIVHADAVQGFCKLPPKMLKADLIGLSAHKIHGPKGIGALYAAKNIRFEPLLYGGGQQKDRRSGTEPVELVAGFAQAVKEYPAPEKAAEHYLRLNERLREQLAALDGISVNSYNNSQNILNFSVKGVRSEIMLHFLEESGIYVSSGSACSRGKTSGVLAAFGVSDKDADSAVRVSFSPFTSEEDVSELAAALAAGIKRLRR